MSQLNKPVLSVITVTFNAQDTISATLDSVREQTYPEIEYIIIDGASSDKTLSIIKNSGTKVHHLLSEPDRGLYDAMNKGAKVASGDYLCFLNAGDTFAHKDTVKQVFDPLERACLPDVIYGETLLVDFDRNIVGARWHQSPHCLDWKSFRKGMLVSHQAFWVKRDLFEPYHLSFRFSSDVDWCIRMLKKSSLVLNTHDVTIHYLQEGMTTAHRKASLKERFNIMCNHYGVLPTLWNHALFVLRAFKRHWRR